MSLNKSKGNMYDFITHTWNTVKGHCHHDCSYCYMKRWGELNPSRLDRKEFKTDLGKDNFIFVGSSCDMFSDDIPMEWTLETIDYCNQFDNKYLFQSKNPARFLKILDHPIIKKSVFCTTIESDIFNKEIMVNSPSIYNRAQSMNEISKHIETYVTIEPIMKFNHDDLINLISICKPKQVNIGADSGGNKLPEPTQEEIINLINALSGFTNVKSKKNLHRLLKTKEVLS